MLSLLQLSDSMFPTGSFAHSYGLETYVQQGLVRDGATLQELLQVQLRYNLAYSDMLICAQAIQCHHYDDRAGLIWLDELLTAAKIAQEAREASIKVGRRLLRSVLPLVADPMLQYYEAEIKVGRCAGHQAIASGLTYAALRFQPLASLMVYAYNFVAGQVSAAVRLMPLGQTQAQWVIQGLQPAMQQAAETALSSNLEDFQSFVPAADIRAMQHAYLQGRLFIS